MRNLIFILLFALQVNSLCAQTDFYVGNVFGRKLPTETTEIEGSPYISKDFKPATIFLNDGKRAENILANINTHENKLVFKNKDEDYILDSFRYAMFEEKSGDTTTALVFATGYPAIDGHGNQTIYQLAGGGKNIHFLKYYYQVIEPKKTMGYYHIKEYIPYTDYYIYSKEHGIIKAKLNPTAIIEALPEMEEKIRAITKSHHLNLHKAGQIATLFNLLDQ